MPFRITDHIEFDQKGRASCPACIQDGKAGNKNLALVPGTDGAYKCHRGCSPKDIREVLGVISDRQVPISQVKEVQQSKPRTCSPQEVLKDHELLMGNSETAKLARKWLEDRGLDATYQQRHRLGLKRVRVDNQMYWSISIPVKANRDGTEFFRKYRVEPWGNPHKRWHQPGVKATVFFASKPTNATVTYLCEGEWDAMRLAPILPDCAVASFTCGCKSTPEPEHLSRLVGKVRIFYDRDQPGIDGARKVAKALVNAEVCIVPGTEEQVALVEGWDVSNALDAGYGADDFLTAPAGCLTEQKTANPLRERLFSNDWLLDKAPDYTEWLVPDLLTQNELFLLAAGARTGKSLLSMTLAKAVATGGEFLGRPTTPGHTLYIAIEDGLAKLKEREQAQGWDRGMPVTWLPKFKLSELPHLREIAEEINDLRLIVIDTLSRVKDSNISESSSEMSQLLEPLQDMANELDCTIVLVHHTGKVNAENAGTQDIFDTIRGSSAIRAVCRGSMVLAASDNSYRLMVENGWGKHDLKVVLDANTLTWRLLGKWNPGQSSITQKEQILDFLRKTQSASLEQIAEATEIPKKSLYEQLSRLQISDVADEKICKSGTRRNYTYSLALFNTIQQLNSVLNSENAYTESNRASIQQNNFFSDKKDQAEATVTPCLNFLPDLSENTPGVEYTSSQASTPDGEGDMPIQQLFNNNSTVEYKSPVENNLDQATGTSSLILPKKKDQAETWMKWEPIDTLVQVLETKGDRARVKVPGKQGTRWVNRSELIDANEA